MCLYPIQVPNYNIRSKYKSLRPGLKMVANLRGKDVVNNTIYVPCGHCAECVAAKQNALVQRVQMESKYNHLFFCTLTYDNQHLPMFTIDVPVKKRAESSLFEASFLESKPTLSYEEIDDILENERFDFSGMDTPETVPSVEEMELYEDGVEELKFPYADIHDIQLLLKRLRDNNPCDGRNIRYIAVTELGKTNGRPHAHILFMIEKRPEDYTWLSEVKLKGLPSRYGVKPEVRANLEKSLYKAVFEYWARNVGTRKEPVYEPLFKYRKRYYGGKVYTNFDLHYVDPDLTPEGTSNVAYYVTKYIMKGSEKERRRQQFLRLNLSEEDYNMTWNTIKCRMVCSKGLGLDARFYTVESSEERPNPDFKCYEYAKYLIALDCNDLPADDTPYCPPPTVRITVQKRIMVPNFDIADFVRKNLARDVGKSPGPIFISPDGKHRPLSHYYQRFGWIYTEFDAMRIWMDAPEVEPHYLMPEEEKKKIKDAHARKLRQMSSNSQFDTSPALLWGTDYEDNNFNPCYGD